MAAVTEARIVTKGDAEVTGRPGGKSPGRSALTQGLKHPAGPDLDLTRSRVRTRDVMRFMVDVGPGRPRLTTVRSSGVKRGIYAEVSL